MKTQVTNTAKKGIKKTGLLLFMVVIAGFAGYAQKSFNPFDLKLEFISNVVSNQSTAFSANAIVEMDHFSGTLDFAVEEPLNVENWMVSAGDWSISETENIKESEIKFEDWMVSSADWVAIEKVLGENVNEDELAYEKWMTDFEAGNIVEAEEEIELEAWMYTIKDWK